jgi:FSR family fosmidomycin resistance protein-like MFS transporter
MRSLIFNKYLWTLTLGHFTIDLYSGAMPVVLLYLTTSLNLSLGQVGLISALYSLCSSISQPIFGYLADRYGGRWLASGGLVWMSIFQGLVGFVPDFNALLFIAPLAGFGSAAFHPPSASSANLTSGDKKSAGMAIFLLGGNGGFAFGPLVAAIVLGGFALGNLMFMQGLGLHGTAVISLVGLLIAPVLYALSTRHQPRRTRASRRSQAGGKVEFNPAFNKAAIVALLLVMSLRAWTQSSVSLYVPQFFTAIGGMTVAEVSRLAFVIFGFLSVGSLAGGFLADRVGGRRVMAVSFLIGAPASLALFAFPAVDIYVSAAVLGFVTGAAWPPTLVMAQELFPKHAGVASGLALGFVFAMGGLGNAITGFVAERIGLLNSMVLVSILPLLAAVCTLVLPSHHDVASAARAARASLDQPAPLDAGVASPYDAGGR